MRDLDVVDAPFPGGVVVVSPAAETRLLRVRITGATGYGVRQTAGSLHARDVTVEGTRLVRGATLPCGPTYDLWPVPFEVYSRGDASAILHSFVDAGPRGEAVLAAGAVLCAPIVRDAFDQISVATLFGHDDLPFSGLAPLLPILPILADAGTGVYVSGAATEGHVFIGLRVQYAERAGVIVSGPMTSATFLDLGIAFTQHDPALGSITVQQAAKGGSSFGGLEARFGAEVGIVDALVVANDVAGIHVHSGANALTLDGIKILATHEVAFADGPGFGDGLLVIEASVGLLKSSTIKSNQRAGVLVNSSSAFAASIEFKNSFSSNNKFGLVTQGPHTVLTPSAWQTELHTEGNPGGNLSDGALAVPDPVAKPPPP